MDYLDCIRTLPDLVAGGSSDGPSRTLGFDAVAYVEFLQAERVLGCVAPSLDAARGDPAWPAACWQAIDANLAQRRERNDLHLDAFVEIHAAFASASLEWLLLKGFALGQRLYGDVHRRWQSDLDLLIPPERLDEALDLLEGRGFALLNPDETHATMRTKSKAGKVRAEVRRGSCRIDIHWGLRRRARRHIDTRRLFASSVPFTLNSLETRTLGDEDTLIFHLLAMAGDLRRGACQGRHFLDLHLLLRAAEGSTDWDAFFERRRPQLLRPCLNVLALYLLVWGTARDLPELVAAVTRRTRQIEILKVESAVALVTRPRDHEANKRWFARVYPFDAWATWARRLTLDLPHALGRLVKPPSLPFPDR